MDDNEKTQGIMVLIIILLIVFIAVIGAYQIPKIEKEALQKGYGVGYKQGQIDYSEGKITIEKREHWGIKGEPEEEKDWLEEQRVFGE